MTDLVIGCLMVFAVSAAMCAATLRLTRSSTRRLRLSLALLVGMFLVGFSLFLRESLWFARRLPFTNVIALADLRVPAASMLAALLWQVLPGPRVRKLAFVTPVLTLSLARIAILFLPPRLELRNRWQGNVCLQTSPSTCSAAAAATLLQSVGVAATEPEMARLCLTTRDGTSVLGLYRGLRLKTDGSPYSVVPFQCRTPELKTHVRNGPVILTVGLPRGARVDPRYQANWGWVPGARHAVVLFGFEGSRAVIGDPSVGLERWTIEALEVLWNGQGIQVVAARPATDSARLAE